MRNVRYSKQNAFAPGFVSDILQHALATAGKPGIYGIVGLQGSGKSTLATQMAALGQTTGLKIAVLSIDDFYFGKRERKALARKIHPLLAKRGPPGTHDVALACEVLDKLKQGKPVLLPKFDKISDTRLAPSRWHKIDTRVDLVLFEGWFLFAIPEAEAALAEPLNRLERDQDQDGVWRAYCNDALKAYGALWHRIGRSLLLQGPGFEQVQQWRWQQEQSLQAANPNRKAMTKKETEEFVLLFERTSRNAFSKLPKLVDRIVRLDGNHKPLVGAKGPPT